MKSKEFVRRVKYYNELPITMALQIPVYCFTIGYSIGNWTFRLLYVGAVIIVISMLLELYFRRDVWYEERTKKVV